MALLNLQDVSISHGTTPVLERIKFRIESGERICIMGRNGSGKSTLLRLLSGEVRPDSGEIQKDALLSVALLPQTIPESLKGMLIEIVTSDLSAKQQAVKNGSNHQPLTTVTSWELEQNAKVTLSRMALNPSDRFEHLSAGLRRRVLCACALARDPDLLLLDEPTNHLDLSAIAWLEDFLLRHCKTLVFVTHDRAFLRRLATRIVEIDRSQLFSWACDYDTFLRRRQSNMDAEKHRQRVFDKKLAQEEHWIRQGIKARRTRNEGRVRALEKMRAEQRQRRHQDGRARMAVQAAEKSGRLVIEAKEIAFSFDRQSIVTHFSTTIFRGDKIGLIGPNGIGKTTLIKILLGTLTPLSGRIRHGTRLQVAYFDQLRDGLDENQSALQNIAQGNDTILFNGRSRHVIGYLQDFLFSPARACVPIKVLSGGEKNRLMLAKLFTRPFNVLIMDEPTNDLDLETLELLEELLFEYSGTLLLVSHDREFLNRVVTHTFVFEGDGRIAEYAGGYDDYLRQRRPPTKNGADAIKGNLRSNSKTKPKPPPRKLGYMQQRELEQLPQRIESMEQHQQELYLILSEPDLYRRGKDEIAAMKKELADLETAIHMAYDRWQQLESKMSTG